MLAPISDAPFVMTKIFPVKKSVWVSEVKDGGMKRVVVTAADGRDTDELWRVWIGTNGFFAFDLALTGSMLIVGGRLQKLWLGVDDRASRFKELFGGPDVLGLGSSAMVCSSAGIGKSTGPFVVAMPFAVETRFAVFFRFGFSDGA